MAGESGSFWALERANRRGAALLVLMFILLLGASGLALDFLLSVFPLFTVAGLILGLGQTIRAYFAGASIALGAHTADPILAGDPKGRVLIDVVHEMALAARLPEPGLHVIDDPAPNALAAGRKPQESVICVTRGLLDELDREELQGVIGYEMAQINSYGIRLTMLVTVLSGYDRGFGVLGPFALVLLPIGIIGIVCSWLISRSLSRKRDYLADAAAVEFTRNPTALLRALQHIAKTEAPVRGAGPATAPFFIVDSFEDSLVSYHAPLADRIAHLRTLAGPEGAAAASGPSSALIRTTRPQTSGGILLFWLVIALSAGAIIGALAIR